MTKTHKSSKIANMQMAYGATGLLVGTIDEAEVFIDIGVKNIAFPYPIANKENIKRVMKLTEKARVILSFDGIEAAKMWNEELAKENKELEYFLLINSGLDRLGVKPEDSVILAKDLCQLKNLTLLGISTHPGHVYGVSSSEEVALIAKQEVETMRHAKELLLTAGFSIKVVATGSTPTFSHVVDSDVFDVLRPGNYPFYDNIQLSLGTCKEEDCTFTVLGTIISKPRNDIFIIDVGSKCLGLDKGAHGNSLVTGFGKVKGHSGLQIISLSEEVGKIKIDGETMLKVGDRIEIIPNHACPSANLTSYVFGYQGDEVVDIISIDARGNSMRPIISDADEQ